MLIVQKYSVIKRSILLGFGQKGMFLQQYRHRMFCLFLKSLIICLSLVSNKINKTKKQYYNVSSLVKKRNESVSNSLLSKCSRINYEKRVKNTNCINKYVYMRLSDENARLMCFNTVITVSFLPEKQRSLTLT